MKDLEALMSTLKENVEKIDETLFAMDAATMIHHVDELAKAKTLEEVKEELIHINSSTETAFKLRIEAEELGDGKLAIRFKTTSKKAEVDLERTATAAEGKIVFRYRDGQEKVVIEHTGNLDEVKKFAIIILVFLYNLSFFVYFYEREKAIKLSQLVWGEE